MLSLPPVAKNIYVECKKCERGGSYCRVLAHTTSTTAKVECEICHKTKKLKIGDDKKLKAVESKTKSTSTRGVNAYKKHYDQLLEQFGDNKVPYSAKSKFEKEAAIDHPKFGLGIVESSNSQKITVAFSDQPRELIHNRG